MDEEGEDAYWFTTYVAIGLALLIILGLVLLFSVFD
jgi:hypothetical protein